MSAPFRSVLLLSDCLCFFPTGSASSRNIQYPSYVFNLAPESIHRLSASWRSIRLPSALPTSPQVTRLRRSPVSAGHPSPQVNRGVSRNLQITSTLSQMVRYTCGRLAAVNVPQNALSPRCALLSPPQVNRCVSRNLQITSILSQIVRYTCGRLRTAMRTTYVDLGTNRLLL